MPQAELASMRVQFAFVANAGAVQAHVLGVWCLAFGAGEWTRTAGLGGSGARGQSRTRTVLLCCARTITGQRCKKRCKRCTTRVVALVVRPSSHALGYPTLLSGWSTPRKWLTFRRGVRPDYRLPHRHSVLPRAPASSFDCHGCPGLSPHLPAHWECGCRCDRCLLERSLRGH
jgi:hypothetical protein